jgi:predicted Zn-dependent protease
MEETKKVASEAVKLARLAAPRGWEVFARSVRSQSLSSLEGLSGSGSSELCVRVFTERGQGLAAGPFGTPPAQLVEEALHAAVSDGLDAGPAPRSDTFDRGLGVDDPRFDLLDNPGRSEVIDWNLESLMAASGIQIGELLYTEERQSRVFVSSRSVELAERSTRFSFSGGVWLDGMQDQPLSLQIWSRNFAEVASRPLGSDLVRRADGLKKVAEFPGGRTPIVLDQRSVGALLPPIAEALDGIALTQGSSIFSGRMGQRVGGAPLHVVDDGLRPGGMATRAFDDRGIRPVPVTIFKEGVLAGWYQGVEQAYRVEARPSGHAKWDGSLWLGNLLCRAGTRSRNMLFPDMACFVMIEEVVEPVVVDRRTGTLRAKVWAARWERNQRIGSLGLLELDTTVDQLLSGVLFLCNDPERHGIVDTPTWVVDGPWFTV